MDTKPEKFESLSAEELLSNGKKAYNDSDYETALVYLSKACKKLAEIHGDMSDEMLKPHFYYAKCLYEFGKQGTDTPNDVEAGENSEKPAEIQISAEKVEDEKDTKVEDKNDEKVGNNSEMKEEEDDEVEDDDVSRYQLALENIECAKLILERQLSEGKHDKKEVEIKLADCHVLAGHILMDNDQDDECLKEYGAALQIQLKYEDMEYLAESYKFLGLACCDHYKWRDAKRYYQECKQVLEKIAVTLDKTDVKWTENQKFQKTIEQSLEDVEEGLKLSDYKESIVKACKDLEAIKRKSSPSKDVNDLNNCVRKNLKLVEAPTATKAA